MSLGKLNIILDLETASFEKGMSKSEQRTSQFSRTFQVNMDKALNSAKQFSQRTTTYLKNIENAANNINSAAKWEFRFNNIDRVKSLGSQIFQLSDSHTELANKIKLVTETEAQHAQAMASVYDISMKTAQSTQAVSAVYQSFAQNAKELGINQQQVASVTETISKAVAISGASTSEAQNALTQFSQTLLMGKMRAQEYNSIMTQTPALMQAIARGLGVTMGELKAMSDDGKLTADKMIQALEKSKKSVDELYGKTATTISGAMQNLSTATEKFVGNLASSTGVANGMASAISVLANNLNYILPTITSVGVTFAGIKLFERTKETIALSNANREVATAQAQVAHATLLRTQQDLAHARVSMQSLSAQLQLARTEQQRALIRTQMQTQAAQIISLTNAETAATMKLAAARQSASLLSGALSMVGGPLGLLTIGLTAGTTLLYNWHQEAEQARQNALSYADSIDQVRTNLEQMTKVQVEAELVKVKRSLQEQEAHLESLKQKQRELQESTQQTVEYIGQEWGGAAVDHKRSTEEIEKAQEELKLTTAEVEKAQNQFNKTLEIQHDLQAHIPVSELRDRFAELFPNIEQSEIKVDGLNVSLGSFISNVPIASVEALKFAGAVGQIATSAINAAIAVANLAGVQVGNEKLNLHIANNDALIEINKARVAGNTKLANELQAKLNAKNKAESLGVKEGSKEWENLVSSELALLNSSPSKGGKTGGRSKTSGSSKKDKLAEKAKRESEKNHENYLNQVAEMSQRLAGLKAEAQEIALFGQPSQYQEVRKLTEDMVINADKYKTIGLEGVEKLKSLAAKLDSESQNIAIQKLKFESNEALDAMQFGLTLLGKTRTEQELIQFNHQLDIEANRLKQGMTAENIAKLDEEIAKLKERRAIIQAEAEKMRQDPVVGLRAGLAEFADDATNISGQIQNVVTGSLSSMTDSLNTFVMTGKTDFRSLAQSILSDINKMIIKMMIFKAIQTGASFLFGYQGATTAVSGNAVYGMGTWATGGYTGDGGKYTPAGIVHRGEYVITKEATSRLGLDYLNYLNYGKRGFATGGGVGVPRVPSTPTHFGGSQNVTVTVINNGKPTSAEVETKKDGQDLAITVKLMEQIADGVYRRNQTRDLRSGGALNRH